MFNLDTNTETNTCSLAKGDKLCYTWEYPKTLVIMWGSAKHVARCLQNYSTGQRKLQHCSRVMSTSLMSSKYVLKSVATPLARHGK